MSSSNNRHPQFFDNISTADNQLGKDFAGLDWNSMNSIDPALGFSFQSSQKTSQAQPPRSGQVHQHAQQQRAREQQQQQHHYHHHHHHHQQTHHPTMQRFVNESQRQFFTVPNLPRQLSHGGLANTSIPTSFRPSFSYSRMTSPPLSQDLTSNNSSAESPPAEQEYYPDSRNIAMDGQHYGQPTQGFPGAPASYQAYALPPHPGYSCVSMDQVQTFADAEDKYYENDEASGEVAMKIKYAIDIDHYHNQGSMKTSGGSQGYRYPSQEGVEASIRDEASPKNTTLLDDGQMSDVDAEGDEEDMEPDILPASDTEYTPKSTRTRKRHAPLNTKTVDPAAKRSRITKPPKTKRQVTCKLCDHAAFKDATDLKRHTATAHTRAYVCVFDFAGCPATFNSKNEWKRHVSSQHLNLTAWICQLGGCNHSSGNPHGSITAGSEFNRKDLFTQHLRRMHAPLPARRKKAGTDANWEETIKDLQQTCLEIKRQAPTYLACPVDSCDTTFEGVGCWDDRMEHVAKHLEAQAQGKIVVRQGDDQMLVHWAYQEGIIVNRPIGGFELVHGSSGSSRRNPKITDDEEDE